MHHDQVDEDGNRSPQLATEVGSMKVGVDMGGCQRDMMVSIICVYMCLYVSACVWRCLDVMLLCL